MMPVGQLHKTDLNISALAMVVYIFCITFTCAHTAWKVENALFVLFLDLFHCTVRVVFGFNTVTFYEHGEFVGSQSILITSNKVNCTCTVFASL